MATTANVWAPVNGVPNIRRNRKTGQYRWEADVTIGGQRYRDSGYAATLKEAKDDKHDAEQEIAKRADVLEAPGIAEEITVEDYLTQWIKNRVALGKIDSTTAANYDQLIERMRQRVVPITEGTGKARKVLREEMVRGVLHFKMKELRTSHVNNMLADLASHGGRGYNLGKPLGWKSIVAAHSFLHVAMKEARPEYISENPVPDDPPFGRKKSKKRPVWTLEETRRFLMVIRHNWYYAMEMTFLSLGPRNGEVAGLLEENIHFDESYVHFAEQDTVKPASPRTGPQEYIRKPLKGLDEEDEGRYNYLSPQLATVLQEFMALKRETAVATKGWQWDPLDHLFVDNKGRQLRRARILRIHYRLCDEADVPRIHVHDLRHTCGTLLGEMNSRREVMKSMLGHSNIATSEHYTQHTVASHVAPQRDAAMALTELLLNETLVTPDPTPDNVVPLRKTS